MQRARTLSGPVCGRRAVMLIEEQFAAARFKVSLQALDFVL